MLVQNIPRNTRYSDRQHIYTVYYMQLVTENSLQYIYLYIYYSELQNGQVLQNNLHRPTYIYISVKQNRSLIIIHIAIENFLKS